MPWKTRLGVEVGHPVGGTLYFACVCVCVCVFGGVSTSAGWPSSALARPVVCRIITGRLFALVDAHHASATITVVARRCFSRRCFCCRCCTACCCSSTLLSLSLSLLLLWNAPAIIQPCPVASWGRPDLWPPFIGRERDGAGSVPFEPIFSHRSKHRSAVSVWSSLLLSSSFSFYLFIFFFFTSPPFLPPPRSLFRFAFHWRLQRWFDLFETKTRRIDITRTTLVTNVDDVALFIEWHEEPR